MTKIETCNEPRPKGPGFQEFDKEAAQHTILPVCPHCYAVYEEDPVQAWGKISCRGCGRIFKYCKRQTYTTEKVSRDAPRESK